MNTISTWRKNVYKELSEISFSGRVLDIGGSSNSGYHSLIGGEHTMDINNIDESHGCTLNFDLEKEWSLADNSYEGILAINILEHIFDYGHVLRESYRVLRGGGKIIIAVPFLISYHPCPHDYWRFTEETLQKILEEVHFSDIHIKPIGAGMWSAFMNLQYNFFSKVPLLWKLNEYLCGLIDFTLLHFGVGKNFSTKSYPMGYVVTAIKK